MAAPYKVWEFTATSGNVARLKVWEGDRKGGCVATWSRPVFTDEDHLELAAWLSDRIRQETGRSPRLAVGASGDMQYMERMVQEHCKPDYEQRRN